MVPTIVTIAPTRITNPAISPRRAVLPAFARNMGGAWVATECALMASNTQARSHPRGGFDGAAGLVGLLIAAEIALLLLPPPVGVEKQARRFLALTAATTALIAGVDAGYFGVADLLAGMQKPSQSVFAFFDGGVIFGVPGLILGALVGSILALDYRGQAGRDGGVRDEVLSFESP
jgi:hypothetical protein